jgi:hypothetical protein
MRIKFAKSARKHHIGKAHALHVIETSKPVITTNQRGQTVYDWLDDDDRGVELEIGAVVVDDGQTLLVIHVMPTHYRRKQK